MLPYYALPVLATSRFSSRNVEQEGWSCHFYIHQMDAPKYHQTTLICKANGSSIPSKYIEVHVSNPSFCRFVGLGVYIAIGERAHAIFFKGVIHQCLVRCIWCSRCRSDPRGSTCNVDDCPYGPSTYPSFADVIDVMFFFKKFCGYEIFGIFLDLQRNAYQDFFSEKKDSAVSRSTLKTITWVWLKIINPIVG